MLSIRNLGKSYLGPGIRQVLRDISLDVARGEYVAIMGESGIGKSTLLNLVAGLEPPDTGSIRIDGCEIVGLDDDRLTRLRRQKMGFVFQAFHLLPYLTVAQNIALPLALNKVAASESGLRVTALLAAIGMKERGDSYARELSGGEMQRVAIARALAHRPQLILADEPTGNLDPASAAQVLALLREQVTTSHAAGILVTHSASAAATTDRTYVLGAGGLFPSASP
ncbi:ABC transporter ATP-binding protein [Sulfurimicrobium lacus]|uniref:ABC transporter ATP-binding protein n=1 Tax=Sulfurimicrobium lacus TaxID=2715678 RepID=A0A6F8VE22_9PROT|nr:ABC transporter ATP-binding protein [Sulfurimicrobium lacus]BCB27590.1 ABC transporter ATP-binding protein [Sulfurimicrobium lacus]